MKTSFLVTFLLAAAVCTHGYEEVLDSNGNPVKVGEKYFIQPVKTDSNNGGGFVPAAITILPFCPLGIIQTLHPDQPGLPVSFQYYPYFFERDTIGTSTTINIAFVSDVWPVCNDFTKLWAIDPSSSADIIVGGKQESQYSAFRIEKAAGEHTYKFTVPFVPYGTVGTKPVVWVPQLIVTTDESKTLFVKFKKADDVSTATTTTRVEKLGLRMFPFY